MGLVLVGVWAFDGLEIRHEIGAFLPDPHDREMAPIAREIMESELSRTIAIAIAADGGDGEREAIAAAQRLRERLRTLPGIAWVRSGPPSGLEEALYALYFPRRYAFFADDPEAARRRLEDASLRAAAARLRRELGGPMAMLIRPIASEDPLLAYPDQVRRIQQSGGTLRVVDGQFVSEDGWAVVIMGTEASPFETVRTAPLLERIEALLAELDRAHGGRLRFERAGLHRFAVRAERQIRSDIQRISILATLGTAVLFVFLYRGPRYLVLGALPIAAGTIAATAACRLVFERVHGITFAFGSSLLGVGIDYVAHYVTHHVLQPDPEGAAATMRRIGPALVLGAATTIAGLAGLAWTSLPGMREMALFAAVGVAVALIATPLLVSPWMPDRPASPPFLARATAAACARVWEFAVRHRRATVALPVLAIGVVGIGMPRLTWIDDLRALNDADPAMVAEEEAVRARLSQGDVGRWVIARGAHDEEALTRSEAASRALERACARGALRRYRSIAPFLRSASLQDRVQHAVIGTPSLAERLIAALEAEGFVGAMFEPFRASLRPAEPLRWPALAQTPLGVLARPFRIELGTGQIAYLTYLDGVRDPGVVRDELAGIEGIEYFDSMAFWTDAYRRFRERTIELLAVGLILVVAMCLIRYRSVRLGLASIAPALLAALTALGLLGIIGSSANLMHLVGALLVLSMGEDYAVFLLESRGDTRAISTTMVGVVVACATTVLSFGLLALSTHPALRALGTMTSLGVLLSLVFSPMALLWGERERP
jgi:predicted exporter